MPTDPALESSAPTDGGPHAPHHRLGDHTRAVAAAPRGSDRARGRARGGRTVRGPIRCPGPGGPHAPTAADAGPGDDPARGPVRVVPVPLADPTVADLLRPGDLVDLVGTAELAPGKPPALVAHAARVRDAPVGRSGARSLLVEVPAADAASLAATAAGTPLAVVVHG
ncbi:hypothetical protein DQ226_03725 [Dietzia maris]|uniref:Flp pilus assembly protein RcpC/CpaB domain-containing protein n=1 Tax=Dietzia maris TaxID=37915 RepID=A0A365PCK4_9ACTN|nr:hypothetical protein DQ226_03725 [Dietzia maris]